MRPVEPRHLANKGAKNLSRTRVPLSPAEKRLLQLMQKDCTLSADELGTRCGMSASTVLRRLRKFRSAGVIRAEVAIIDAAALGRPLVLFLSVRLERDDASVIQEFSDWVDSNPSITQCYFVTGTMDYILHISARDMEDYDQLIRFLLNNPNVVMSETQVVIRPLKSGFAIPIED